LSFSFPLNPNLLGCAWYSLPGIIIPKGLLSTHNPGQTGNIKTYRFLKFAA
jgi:hypothetical protein